MIRGTAIWMEEQLSLPFPMASLPGSSGANATSWCPRLRLVPVNRDKLTRLAVADWHTLRCAVISMDEDFCGNPMNASTPPSTILIIRHGEKSGDPGVDDSANGIDLSTRGYERAAALAPYVIATFGAPAFLFATQASTHSNRPVETITPLSQALKLKINSDYAEADYAALASEILGGEAYAGKLVLICWHHGNIPALTQALGGQPPVAHWPGTVFDRVWKLSYPPGAKGSAGLPVTSLPQKLLFGDDSV